MYYNSSYSITTAGMLGNTHLTILQTDDHFVTINYYADTSEDLSNDKTSTNGPHLQIHDNNNLTETSIPDKKRISVAQPKVARHRLQVTAGILFIIGLFSVPIVLYNTQDRVDLSALTAIGNTTLVSIYFYDMCMHVNYIFKVNCISAL